jgi:RNA polymerase sigma factor (sigma-70 family)
LGQSDWLAERFEENRNHLRAVAYRMLGSLSEADDAVQETWLRLSRSETRGVENLAGWLTTVVARVCLDVLRSRKSRREDSLETKVAEPIASGDPRNDPEGEALLADSVGLALLVVLERLTPAERLAFSTRSPGLWGVRQPRPGSSPAARADECREGRRSVTEPSLNSGKLSMRF